jgi:hypothetical protein
MPRSRTRAGRDRDRTSAGAGIRTQGRPPSRLALVLGLALACGDDGKAEGGSDEGASGTSDGAPALPSFAEPASGRLSLAAIRTEDVRLAVQNVEPGQTELVIDDHGMGPLGNGASAGRLDAEALVLHVRGSMVAGLHHMFLRTSNAHGIGESEVIEVEITSELNAVPVAEPTTPSGREGERILALGEGPDALLVVLHADAQGPRLHLVPRGETGWDAEAARTVAAPGLALAPDERGLPATALRYGRTDDDPGRVRVAYRAGLPGTRIDLVDAPWDAAAPELPPGASLAVSDALAGRPAEWAELGRPWLIGDLLVVELWAPLDVESPRPGDHTLVWSRVHDEGRNLDGAQRVSTRAELVDLDLLGPALDRVGAEANGPAILTIRADRHQPLVLEHDPGGGLRVRPTVLDGSDRTFSFVDLPLATVVGAFGARTVAGVTASSSGRMRLALMDDLGKDGLQATSLGDDDLPPFDQITGELAPGSVGGLTVFLVPYGPEIPVQALHSAGGAVTVTPLTDLRCDGVALATAPDPGGEVPLACTLDGQLRLGTLRAMPQP